MTATQARFVGATQLGLGLPHFDVIQSRPQMGIGSFQWCLSSNHVEFSPAFWRMLGLPANTEPNGRSFLDFVHPDQREKAAEKIRAAVSLGDSVFEYLFRMNATNSQIQVALIRAKIVRVEQRATRIEGVAIDVTRLPKLLLGYE